MRNTLFFLDFDGVVHPTTGYQDPPFCRLPLLANLLGGIDIDIVISSSWRFHHDLIELQVMLGDVGRKVVATTGGPSIGRYARFSEIREYAEANKVSDWLALDDSSYEFPSGEARVLLCDPRIGIEESQVNQLGAWIKGLTHENSGG